MNTDKFKHKKITNTILKSFYEVYNELGNGFLESVYENALDIVLTGYGMQVERQPAGCVYLTALLLRNPAIRPQSSQRGEKSCLVHSGTK